MRAWGEAKEEEGAGQGRGAIYVSSRTSGESGGTLVAAPLMMLD